MTRIVLGLVCALLGADAAGLTAQTEALGRTGPATSTAPAPSAAVPAPAAISAAAAPVPAPAMRRAPGFRLWGLDLSASSVFDSNVDHDLANLHSYGSILGIAARFRDRATHPSLELAYEAALHEYSGTSRWDGVSQHGAATLARDLGRLRLAAIADAALHGTSDDRKLDDRYTLMSRASLRLDASRRIQLSAAYRLRRSRQEPGRNAEDPYGSIVLEQAISRATLAGSYRYEAVNTRDPRRRDRRSIASLAVETPLGAADALELEAKTRWQRYPNKLVPVGGLSVPRQDFRWNPALTWTHRLIPGLRAELSYEYERRDSNQPGEDFRAHLFGLTLVRSW